LYATRFSDEVFALLIAWIFIFDAIGNPVSGAGVLMYFKENHKSHKKLSSDPNYNIMASALLSVILCFGTTAVAFLLRSIKGGPFCYSPKIRSLLTDFALLTSIFLWTTIDLTVFGDIKTDRLNVPDTFSPTYNCCTEACKTFFPDECPDQSEAWGRRPWVVNLFDNNGKTWLPFATAGTALLGFVLVYLDDGITWHLLNHPSHKLTHGDAMTYDTCLIGIMMIVNANLGLPIVVASTVPCLNHLHALSTKDSKGNIVKVQQTRWSGLIISILMCCSLFALPLLKLIPVPVLLGVFLFMGLVSLGTNQLYGRFLMFFMQPSKYPKEPYTLHMKKSKMHTFTAIQLIIFAGLYVVIATKTLAITFPFFILACIPIRLYILPKYFTEEELLFIDSDEDAINEFLTNQNMHESTARGFQNAKLHKADVTGGMDVEKGEKTLAAGGESDSDDALAENS
jgi:preprotein translocase subunit Sec61beta